MKKLTNIILFSFIVFSMFMQGFSEVKAEDLIPPTFDTIPTQTIEAGDYIDIDWTTYIVNAEDDLGGPVTLHEVIDNVDYDTPGTYSVTVKVVDEALNETSQTFDVIVEDTTAPTFDTIATQTIEAGTADIDWTTYITTAADNSDGILTEVEVTDNVDYDTPGTYQVTVTLTDPSLNVASQTFDVIVEDTTNPTFDTIATQTIEAGTADIDWTTYITTPADNSDGILTEVEVTDNVDYDTPGTYTVTVTLTDPSLNVASQTFDVIVEDTTAPTFDTIATQTIEAGTADIDWTTYITTAADNSDGILTEVEVTDNVDYDTPGTYQVTVTLTDPSLNVASQTFDVIVEDTTAPTFDTIATQTIEAGTADIDWTTYITTPADNSDGILTEVEVTDNVDYDTPGTYQVTVTLTDPSLNVASQTFDVIVEDTTAPTFDTIATQTIEAGTADIDWTTYITTPADNSDGILTEVEVTDNVDYDTPGTYQVTVTLTDPSLNVASQTFDVIVEDTTAPTFDIIPTQTIEAGTADIDWTTYITTAADNSDGILTQVEVTDNVDYDTPGTYQVTVTLTDPSLNVASQTFDVIVEDTTAPTFDTIATQTIEAGTADIDWTTYITTPADNSDGILTETEVIDNVDYDTPGTYQVTVTLTDPSLNVASQTFDVIVEDTTAPTFDTIATQTIEAGTADIDWTTYITTPADNSDGILTEVEVTDNVDYDTPGTYQVTVTLTDPSLNVASQTFDVIVEDTTAPTFDTIATQTIEAGTADIDWTTYITTPADNSDGILTQVEVTDNVDYDTPGTYQVTVTLTDPSLNVASQTFDVIVEDTTNPTFDIIPTQTIEAGTADIDWTTYITTPADNSDGILTQVEVTDNVDYDTPSTYTVTVTLTDPSLNVASQTFDVIVEDTTNPTFDTIPTQTIEAGTADIDWTTYITTPADNSDGILTQVEVTDNVDYDTPSTYTVTVTLTDPSLNVASQTFDVIVEDTTNPTFDTILDQTIEAGTADIDWTTYITTPADNSDGILTQVEVTDNVDYDTPGTYSVTVKVVDEALNETSQTFDVTVEDTTNPTFDIIPTQTIEAGTADIDWTTYITTPADNSDGILTQVEVTDNVDYDTPNTYTVTVTLTDPSLNVASQTFDVIVEDTTNPTFDIIPTQTIEAGTADIDWTTYITTPADNSDGILTQVEVTDNVDYDTPSTYTVTVTLTDPSLNVASQTFDVIVEDTTNPTFDTIPTQTIEAGTADIDWTTYITTPADNSDGILTQVEVTDNVDYDTPSTYTVTVTLTDPSLNVASQTFDVIVEDTTNPTFDIIPTQTIEAGTADIDWTTYITTPADNSDGILTQVEVTDNVDYDTPSTYTVTVTLTDPSLNVASQTFDVIVEDTTNPTFDIIPTQTIEAGTADIDWTTYITTPADNSDGILTQVEVTDNVDYDTPGTYQVTVTLTDPSLNVASQTFDVIVEDTTNPTFDTIATQTIEAGTADIDWTTYITTPADNSDGILTEVEVTDNVDYDTPGTYTVTVTLTDPSLNVASQTFDVIVEDTTNPTFDTILDQTIEAGTADIDWTTYITTPADNSDGILTQVEVTDNVDYDTPGTYSVTVKVVDEALNETSQTFDVTVEDTTNPTFDIIPTQTIEAGTADIDWTTYITTPADNSDGILTQVEVTDNVDYDTPNTYTVTVTLTDPSLNVASQTFDVIVEDTTNPTFDIIPTQTIEAGTADIDWTTYITTPADNSDGILTQVEVTDNVDYNALSTYTVTVTLVDEALNETSQTFDVTVQDTTIPVITLIGDTTIYVEYEGTYTEDGATFTDNYDVDGDAVVGGDVVDVNTLGTYIVTYNVTDSEGNVALEVTRTVIVQDATVPIITLTGDSIIYVEYQGTYIELGAIFTDNSDPSGDAIVGGQTVDTSTLGTYTVTYNITDSQGNDAVEVTRTVIVEDTTVPVITLTGDSTIYVEYQGIYTESGATFTDNYDVDGDAVVGGDVVDVNTLGTYIVTYNFTDSEGNLALEVTRTVIVEDTTLPVITLTGDSTIYVEFEGIYTEDGATFTDNYDVDGDAVVGGQTVDVNTLGTYTVTYNITDSQTNVAVEVTRTVIVQDTTAPTFDTIVDQTIEAGSVDIDWTTLIVNEADNYSVIITKVEVTDNVDYNALSTYTVTVKLVDEALNETSQTFNVTVQDTTIPVITLTGDSTVHVEYQGTYTEDGATFTDNYDVDGDAVVGGDVVDVNTLGTYIVTYNVTDSEGNIALEVTRTVIVEDTTVPVITLTGDSTVHVEYQGTYTEDGATFTDNYDTSGAAVVGGDTVDVNTLGTYIITYNVTDSEGNIAVQVTRTVIVEDTTIPVITLTGSSTINVEYQGTYTELGATFTDNYDTSGAAVVGGDTVNSNILGTYIITYNVTDSEGNIAVQVTRTVIVEDTTIPVITLTGSSTIHVEYQGTYTELGATFTDNYDVDGDAVVGGDVVDVNTLGTYIVTYNFTDSEGNVALEVTRTVIVEDTTSPTFDTIVDQTIETGTPDTDWTTLIVNETDNHPGTLTKVEVIDNVDYDTPGTYTVTVKLVDVSLNETSQLFNVTVQDLTLPVITLTGDSTIYVEYSETYTELGATYTDNNDPSGDAIVGGDIVDVNTLGTYTVTYNFTDTQGNAAVEVTRIVIVQDTTAPTFDTIIDQTIEAGTTDIDWKTYIINPADNSDGILTETEVMDNVDYDTAGSYTVTVKLVDESLNETSQLFNVTVEDTTAPIFDAIGDQTIEAGVTNIDWSTYINNPTDNSDGALTKVEVTDNVDYDTPGTYTVMVLLIDQSVNVSSELITVTVVDTTSPTFDLIDDQTIEAGTTDIDWTSLIINPADNSDGILTKVEVTDNVDYNTPGTYIVIVKLVDESLNETSKTFDVIVEDTVAPTFDTISDQTIEAGVSDIDWTSLIVNESDNINGILTKVEVTDNVDYDTPGTYTVTVRLVDESLNETSQTFNVTVEDTIVPTFDTITDQTIESGTLDIDWTTLIINPADNSDGILTHVEVTDNVDYDTPGTYTVTVRLVDESLNETSQTFNVTVEDTTVPTFDTITDQTIEAGTSDIDWTTLIINPTDNSDGILTEIEVIDNVDYDTVGIYTVTVKLVDILLNETSQTFNVTVEDTIAPIFDTIIDQTIEVGTSDIDWSTYVHNPTDNSNSVLTELEVIDNINYDAVGTYTVTVQLVDESLNETSQTFDVTVQDTTIPVITLIGDTTIYVEYEGTYIEDGATFTDNYDVAGDAIVGGQTVDTGSLGTYTVTYNVTDSEGNLAIEVTRTVIVQDTTVPTFDTITDQTIEAGTSDTDWTALIINPEDNSNGTLTEVEFTDNVDYDTAGTYTVTVKLVDESLNETSQTFNVIVEDTTSPTFDTIVDQTIEAGLYTSLEEIMTNIVENSDDVLIYSEPNNQIDYNTPGIYTVTARLTDNSGNYSEQVVTITVVDTVSPTFDTIANKTIAVGVSDIDWSTYIINPSDNTDGILTKVEVTDNVNYDTPGTYTVTVKLVDESLNETSQTFNVTLGDTTVPTFDTIVPQTIELGVSDIDWSIYIINPEDNSSGTLSQVEVTDNVDYNILGTYTVTVKLVDESLNETSQTFNVTVEDTVAPTFDTITPQTIEIGTTDIDWTTYINNEADNSSGLLTNVEVTDNVNYIALGTYTVTVKVVDESLNETSLTFNVTVEDTVVPTFDTIIDQAIEVGVSDIDWSTYITNTSDNSEGILTKVEVTDNVTYNTLGTYTVIVKVVDESLNETSLTFNVTVEDTTIPVITLISESTIYVDYQGTYTESGATFTDNYDVDGDAVVGGDTVDSNALGTYTITYNITDNAGNIALEVTRTVIVQDTIAPTFDAIADQTIEAGTTDIDWTTLIVNEADNAGGSLNKVEVTDNVDYDTPGTYTVTVKVIDVSLNETSHTFDVLVEDTLAPTFDTIASQIIDIGISDIDWTTYIVNPDDNSDVALTLIEVTDNVIYDTEGTYTVTVKLVDGALNELLQTFDVTVEILDVGDITAPVVTLNASLDTLIQNELYHEYGVSYTDEDPTVTVSIVSNLNVTEAGTYQIVYTVEDSSGNTTVVTRVITVLNDKREIQFTLEEANTTIEVGSTYIDGICSVEVDGELFSCDIIENLVNTSTEGIYTITYGITFNEITYTYERYVFVYTQGNDVTLYYRKEEEVLV